MCLHRKITLRKSGVKISNPFVKKNSNWINANIAMFFYTSLAMGSNIFFVFMYSQNIFMDISKIFSVTSRVISCISYAIHSMTIDEFR